MSQSKKTYNAAVIGLGNIGFQFNLDPKRKETWSHVSAYEKCERTKLVAAVEIDKGKRELFEKYFPNTPVIQSVHDVFENREIDIVSVCTPTETHFDIFNKIMEFDTKAIFCEKPFMASVKEADLCIKRAREKKVVLSVNHTRRWDSNYMHCSELISGGAIGEVKAVHGFYPGGIYNMGTHLLDTVRMLTGRYPEKVSGVFRDVQSEDPPVSGWIRFSGDVDCTFLSTGKEREVIVEIDVLGTEGRLRIIDNGNEIELYKFCDSQSYSGYRELMQVEPGSYERKDRFVEAVSDIVEVLDGKKKETNCSGEEGLWAIIMTQQILESATRDGEPIQIKDYVDI